MDNYTPSARDIIGPFPLIAIENEAPAKLIVDPLLPESLFGCSLYPGSTLAPTLAPSVALPDGSKDLYIQQDKFHCKWRIPCRDGFPFGCRR